MFGNINAQIVKEDSSGELKVDCWLLKENVEYDKRVKVYKLSENFKQTIINWINSLKEITNES